MCYFTGTPTYTTVTWSVVCRVAFSISCISLLLQPKRPRFDNSAAAPYAAPPPRPAPGPAAAAPAPQQHQQEQQAQGPPPQHQPAEAQLAQQQQSVSPPSQPTPAAAASSGGRGSVSGGADDNSAAGGGVGGGVRAAQGTGHTTSAGFGAGSGGGSAGRFRALPSHLTDVVEITRVLVELMEQVPLSNEAARGVRKALRQLQVGCIWVVPPPRALGVDACRMLLAFLSYEVCNESPSRSFHACAHSLVPA